METTKLRIGVIDFSVIGPSCSSQPSTPSRVCSASQMRRVAPVVDRLVGADLHVEARDLGRAHGVHAEAVGVQRVDEVVGRRRDVGEDAEPAERVAPFERLQFARAEPLAADAVVAVGADDEVGLELVHPAA